LYGILCKYEWNSVASKYFLKPSEGDSDDEGPKVSQELQIDTRLMRMMAVSALKTKVVRAHDRATFHQMEEENFRFQAAAKQEFDAWISKAAVAGQLGSKTVASSDEAPAHFEPVKPEDLWEEVTKLIQADGLRARIRELEDSLTNLLPLAERARGGETGRDSSGDSAFWKRVMKQVKQSVNQGQKAYSAKEAQWERSRRRSTKIEVSLMDVPRLLTEVTAIWTSLIAQQSTMEASRVTSARMSAQQVLQAAIKTFYLRKTGRSKFVEASVVALCKSVFTAYFSNPKISLFSIMGDIQNAESMEGKLPSLRRKVDLDFSPKLLRDMPLDAAYVMAGFMRELKSLRRSKKFEGMAHAEDSRSGQGDASDYSLPLQLVLSAGRACICCRSRATARCFYLALLGFVKFSPRLHSSKMLARIFMGEATGTSQGEEGDVPDSPEPASPRSGTSDPTTPASPIGGGVPGADETLSGRVDISKPLPASDRETLQDMVYVSHLIQTYVWQRVAANAAVGILTTAQTEAEKEEEVLNVLWSRLLENAQSVSAFRRELGLAHESGCTGKKSCAMPCDMGCCASSRGCGRSHHPIGMWGTKQLFS
jgi:hypothetical protein